MIYRSTEGLPSRYGYGASKYLRMGIPKNRLARENENFRLRTPIKVLPRSPREWIPSPDDRASYLEPWRNYNTRLVRAGPVYDDVSRTGRGWVPVSNIPRPYLGPSMAPWAKIRHNPSENVLNPSARKYDSKLDPQSFPPVHYDAVPPTSFQTELAVPRYEERFPKYLFPKYQQKYSGPSYDVRSLTRGQNMVDLAMPAARYRSGLFNEKRSVDIYANLTPPPYNAVLERTVENTGVENNASTMISTLAPLTTEKEHLEQKKKNLQLYTFLQDVFNARNELQRISKITGDANISRLGVGDTNKLSARSRRHSVLKRPGVNVKDFLSSDRDSINNKDEDDDFGQDYSNKDVASDLEGTDDSFSETLGGNFMAGNQNPLSYVYYPQSELEYPSYYRGNIRFKRGTLRKIRNLEGFNKKEYINRITNFEKNLRKGLICSTDKQRAQSYDRLDNKRKGGEQNDFLELFDVSTIFPMIRKSLLINYNERSTNVPPIIQDLLCSSNSHSRSGNIMPGNSGQISLEKFLPQLPINNDEQEPSSNDHNELENDIAVQKEETNGLRNAHANNSPSPSTIDEDKYPGPFYYDKEIFLRLDGCKNNAGSVEKGYRKDKTNQGEEIYNLMSMSTMSDQDQTANSATNINKDREKINDQETDDEINQEITSQKFGDLDSENMNTNTYPKLNKHKSILKQQNRKIENDKMPSNRLIDSRILHKDGYYNKHNSEHEREKEMRQEFGHFGNVFNNLLGYWYQNSTNQHLEKDPSQSAVIMNTLQLNKNRGQNLANAKSLGAKNLKQNQGIMWNHHQSSNHPKNVIGNMDEDVFNIVQKNDASQVKVTDPKQSQSNLKNSHVLHNNNFQLPPEYNDAIDKSQEYPSYKQVSNDTSPNNIFKYNVKLPNQRTYFENIKNETQEMELENNDQLSNQEPDLKKDDHNSESQGLEDLNSENINKIEQEEQLSIKNYPKENELRVTKYKQSQEGKVNQNKSNEELDEQFNSNKTLNESIPNLENEDLEENTQIPNKRIEESNDTKKYEVLPNEESNWEENSDKDKDPENKCENCDTGEQKHMHNNKKKKHKGQLLNFNKNQQESKGKQIYCGMVHSNKIKNQKNKPKTNEKTDNSETSDDNTKDEKGNGNAMDMEMENEKQLENQPTNNQVFNKSGTSTITNSINEVLNEDNPQKYINHVQKKIEVDENVTDDDTKESEVHSNDSYPEHPNLQSGSGLEQDLSYPINEPLDDKSRLKASHMFSTIVSQHPYGRHNHNKLYRRSAAVGVGHLQDTSIEEVDSLEPNTINELLVKEQERQLVPLYDDLLRFKLNEYNSQKGVDSFLQKNDTNNKKQGWEEIASNLKNLIDVNSKYVYNGNDFNNLEEMSTLYDNAGSTPSGEGIAQYIENPSKVTAGKLRTLIRRKRCASNHIYATLPSATTNLVTGSLECHTNVCREIRDLFRNDRRNSDTIDIDFNKHKKEYPMKEEKILENKTGFGQKKGVGKVLLQHSELAAINGSVGIINQGHRRERSSVESNTVLPSLITEKITFTEALDKCNMGNVENRLIVTDRILLPSSGRNGTELRILKRIRDSLKSMFSHMGMHFGSSVANVRRSDTYQNSDKTNEVVEMDAHRSLARSKRDAPVECVSQHLQDSEAFGAHQKRLQKDDAEFRMHENRRYLRYNPAGTIQVKSDKEKESSMTENHVTKANVILRKKRTKKKGHKHKKMKKAKRGKKIRKRRKTKLEKT